MDSIILSNSNKPLYLQIYEAMRAEIVTGGLSAGEKLPSKRLLAHNLGVSINTVDTAYQMLVAEGYVCARAKSGFYAEHILQSFSALHPPAMPPQPLKAEKWQYNFGTGSIDTALFPFKLWCRIQRDTISRPELLNHGDKQGDFNLRLAVAAYLHEYRGVNCSADSIVIGAGIEYLLGIIARFFKDKSIALEDPGYERAARILRFFGTKTVYADVDESGMSVSALIKTDAAAAYLTPSCQFPTGVTMPVSRRIELLQWAEGRKGRYLIEDDYNSEFRFSTRPVPSLQGLRASGSVIYIGTFSKSVAPSIRVAYMVLPPALLKWFKEDFGHFSSTVSRFEQQALYTFLSDGHFARHLSRLRTACRKRRDILIESLQKAFGKNVEISAAQTGLHIIATMKNGLSETQLIRLAQENGINMSGLSEYFHTEDKSGGKSVILGYSALNEQQIIQAVEILSKAWSEKKINPW